MYDSTYLRIDGGNSMTNNLNLGSKGIYNMAQGINDPGVTNANSTVGSNNIFVSGNISASGDAIIGGNTTVTGNITTTTNLSVGGTSNLSGDINAGGNLNLTNSAGDISLQKLTSQGYLNSQLGSLSSKLTPYYAYYVSHGTTVPAPVCGPGASFYVDITLQNQQSTVSNGTYGVLISASGSGPWVMSMTDASPALNPLGSNPPTPSTAAGIARTYCYYGT